MQYLRVLGLRWGLSLLASSLLGGCGTHEPQEFVYTNRQVYLPTRADNGSTFLFLLDSGLSRTAISKREIQNFTRHSQGPLVEIGGVFGPGQARNVDQVAVRVAGTRTVLPSVLVVDQLPQAATDLQGILGADFLKQTVVAIDFRTKEITAGAQREQFGDSPQWIRIPIEFNEGGLPLVQVQQQYGSNVLSGLFILDTGYNRGLLLFTNLYRNLAIWPDEENKGPDLTVTSFFGTRRYQKLRVDGVKIGELTSKDVLIDVPLSSSGHSWPGDAIGAIGNAFWERTRIILDLPHKTLWVEVPKPGSKPNLRR
jgi:hypothetical protein